MKPGAIEDWFAVLPAPLDLGGGVTARVAHQGGVPVLLDIITMCQQVLH